MNLVWNLTDKDIASLLGLDADTSVTVVEPSRPFGGYTGEKALIRIAPRNRSSHYVLLKRTHLAGAQREVQAYRALASVGAPVVACYGLHPLSDDLGVVAVEYLPDAVDWPVSSERHRAWAIAVAAFARCPIPKEVELPHISFLAEHDTILAGLEAAARDSDPVLRAALAEVNPGRVLARAEDVLASFLEDVDALPRGLTHGECYPMHMGRRTLDGPVLD